MKKFLLTLLCLLTASLAVKAEEWTAVTAETVLEDGDVIALTSKSYTGTYSKTSVTINPMVATAINNNLLTCAEFNEADFSNAYEILLEKSGDNYILKHVDSENVVFLKALDKKISESSTNPNQTFSITVENGGNIVIKCNNTITNNKTHTSL